MNFDNHTFRCSSLGYIMVEPKEKSYKQRYEEAKLSWQEKEAKYIALPNKATKTAENLLESVNKAYEKMEALEPMKDIVLLATSVKTHLADVYISTKYGRREDIKSKYMEKGLHKEEDGITLYSMTTGLFFKKNTTRLKNEFIEGEFDYEDDEHIYDNKSNWSIFQFGRVRTKPINPMYFWQLQGYMWLSNKRKSKLIYTLLDTPDFLIQKEKTNLMYEMFGSPSNFALAAEERINAYEEACAEITRNHTYSDIPDNEKVFSFDIERNDECIDKIKLKIPACRTYLNNFETVKQLEDETED